MRQFMAWLGVGWLMAGAAWAATGETFYVTRDGAELQAKPGLRGKPLLTLSLGAGVVEVSRQGSWVQVRMEGMQSVGWMPESDLGRSPLHARQADLTPPDPTFLKKFDALFTGFEAGLPPHPKDKPYFLNKKDLGNGILTITVSKTWLDLPELERKNHINAIADMWHVSQNRRIPVTVNMEDEQGLLKDFKTLH